MTYGQHIVKKYEAYCGNCGRYLMANEVFIGAEKGKKGATCCVYCNNQARVKPEIKNCVCACKK